MTSGARTTPAAGLEEATLVVRSQDGDVEAFEELLRRYDRPLLRLCTRMLRDPGEAEDVVQDTFLTVWRRLSTLESIDQFRTWLYRTASNRCLDIIRRRERRPAQATDPDSLGSVESGGPSLEDSAETGAAVRHLEQVLGTLPAEQRMAWLLHEVEGETYATIAAMMGTTDGSVRGRLHRARTAIVRGMEGWA
ncbi:RNA polymerase sigma factor [Nesterenkonia halophila]|uniref:RNA polymerase sigma factor n=1 Tax=Nesterenkonia halophila TaxID=302044 RepID=UPI0012916A71|nr:sigma-70 family RNA polymerase sigma factor [Nesterenkonia halophila]